MRSPSISSHFSLAAVALALVACSDAPAQGDGGAATCELELTGNIYGAAQVPACSSASKDADAGGDWILKIDTSTPQVARILATIDLGDTPTPGQLTNETVTAWDAIALSATTSCAFQAGSTEVPNGSFTLQLDSFDAPTSTAHGTFTVDAWVHAPPTTDCSYGDIENITIHF